MAENNKLLLGSRIKYCWLHVCLIALPFVISLVVPWPANSGPGGPPDDAGAELAVCTWAAEACNTDIGAALTGVCPDVVPIPVNQGTTITHNFAIIYRYASKGEEFYAVIA